MTWLAVIVRAVRLLGAVGIAEATTVTAAVPATTPPPAVARTVAEPAVAGAVYRPDAVTVPPPPGIDQVNDGWATRAVPNWSFAVAVNCWAEPAVSVTVAGLTETL